MNRLDTLRQILKDAGYAPDGSPSADSLVLEVERLLSQAELDPKQAIAQLFAHPAKYSILGLANRFLAHTEIAPNFGCGMAIDCQPPKALPGRFFEITANQPQGSVHQSHE